MVRHHHDVAGRGVCAELNRYFCIGPDRIRRGPTAANGHVGTTAGGTEAGPVDGHIRACVILPTRIRTAREIGEKHVRNGRAIGRGRQDQGKARDLKSMGQQQWTPLDQSTTLIRFNLHHGLALVS